MRDVDLHGGCRLALVRLETSWIKRGWSGTRCLGHCPVGRGAVHLRQAAEVRGVRPAHRWEDGRRQGQRHEDEGLSELRPQHPGEGLARRRPPHRPLAPASAPRHGFTDTGNTKKQRGLFVFFVAPPPPLHGIDRRPFAEGSARRHGERRPCAPCAGAHGACFRLLCMAKEQPSP